MRVGIGQVRQRGQHHRPVGVPARGDLTLGQCHLCAGAAHVQRGCLRQPLVPPGDLAGQHEVHLGDTGAEPVTAQRGWRTATAARRRRCPAARWARCRRAPRPPAAGSPPRRAPVRRRGPADRRSSASEIDCEPPTGMGQPTACPSVASISPAPDDTSDGIREIVCAATPVNNARASSPRSRLHAGVPCASSRSPARTAVGRSDGSDRLSPRNRLSTPSRWSASGPSNERQEAPSSSSAQVRVRSR